MTCCPKLSPLPTFTTTGAVPISLQPTKIYWDGNIPTLTTQDTTKTEEALAALTTPLEVEPITTVTRTYLTQAPLPLYKPKQSHKKRHKLVYALLIQSVSTVHNTSIISFANFPPQENLSSIKVSPATVRELSIRRGHWYILSPETKRVYTMSDNQFRTTYSKVPPFPVHLFT